MQFNHTRSTGEVVGLGFIGILAVIGIFMLIFALAIPLCLWQAYVLKTIYTWYLAEWVGRPMTYGVALGIAFIYDVIKTPQVMYRDHKQVTWFPIVAATLGPLMLLFIAWFIKFHVL